MFPDDVGVFGNGAAFHLGMEVSKWVSEIGALVRRYVKVADQMESVEHMDGSNHLLGKSEHPNDHIQSWSVQCEVTSQCCMTRVQGTLWVFPKGSSTDNIIQCSCCYKVQ